MASHSGFGIYTDVNTTVAVVNRNHQVECQQFELPFKNEDHLASYASSCSPKTQTSSLEAFTSNILREMKQHWDGGTSNILRDGDGVRDVVITVPTFYNNKDRVAIVNAAKTNNLNVLQLLNETTALAYCYINR